MGIKTADVVIIGGGCTGASIAYHLAQRGVTDVVVLERKFLASGGTGYSVGILRQLYPAFETSQMVFHSLRVFQHFSEIVGSDAGYVQCGAIIAVPPPMAAGLRRNLQMQRPIGIQARFLAPAEIQEIEHRIDPFAVGAGVWEPESGYGDPVGVTQGFANAAKAKGVRVEQMAEVTAIRRENGRVTGVLTASGDKYQTHTVVNAAGLWSPHIGRLAGLELPIIIGRHPVFVIKRGPGFGPPHPIYLDLASGTYVRPESGDLTLTGSLDDNEAEHPIDPELLGSDVGFDEVARALKKASQVIPALADGTYTRGWTGAFDISPDWMPILDRAPDLEGFYVAAGMSGHGFKLSPAVGMLMAELITGAAQTIDLAPFRWTRFAPGEHAGSHTFVCSYLG